MHFLWLFIVLFPLHAFLAAFDFVLFLHVFLATVALQGFTLLYFRRIKIHPYPLYKGIMGFLPNIGLGLLIHFAFFSLHLFTTLG